MKNFTLKSGNNPDIPSFFKDTTTTETSAPPSDEITKKTNDEESEATETATSSTTEKEKAAGFQDLGEGVAIHPSGVMRIGGEYEVQSA